MWEIEPIHSEDSRVTFCLLSPERTSYGITSGGTVSNILWDNICSPVA